MTTTDFLTIVLPIIDKAALAILVVAHVGFFALEWFWLATWAGRFRTKLGFKAPQDEVAIVGKNQAFSNLILAAGIAFGWILRTSSREYGNAVLLFFLVSIGIAGLVGVGSIRGDKKPFFLLQTLPAVVGILAVIFEPKA